MPDVDTDQGQQGPAPPIQPPGNLGGSDLMDPHPTQVGSGTGAQDPQMIYEANPVDLQSQAPSQDQQPAAPQQQQGAPPPANANDRYRGTQDPNRPSMQVPGHIPDTPFTRFAKFLIGWHEGTGGLLNLQRLEQGALDLENHRQFYDYKMGSPDHVMQGMNGELDRMQGMHETGVAERDKAPAGAGGGGGGGGALGAGTPGGAGPGGPSGGANMAQQTVPQQFQARQAQYNAMDSEARNSIMGLLRSGDPGMASTGAGLYQAFQNGELNRQMLAARLQLMQRAFTMQPISAEPPPGPGQQQGQGAPGAQSAQPQGDQQQPVTPAEQEAPTALPPNIDQGALQPQQQPPAGGAGQAAPTAAGAPPPMGGMQVLPAALKTEASSAPVPGGPGVPGGAASPGPQAPTPPPDTGAQEAQAQQAPGRTQQPEGMPEAREAVRDIVPPGWQGHEQELVQWLRNQANKAAQQGALKNAAINGLGSGDIATAKQLNERANRIETTIGQTGAAITRQGAIAARRMHLTETDQGPVYKSEAELMRERQQGGTDAQRLAHAPGNPDVWTPPPGAGGKAPAKVEMGEKKIQAEGQAAADRLADVTPKLQQNVNALRMLYRAYEPGALAGQKAKAIMYLRSIGMDQPLKELGIDVNKMASWNPDDFQAAIKYSANQFLNQLHNLPGGQVRNMEMKGVHETLAEPYLPAGAVRKIIGQMGGMLAYDNKYDHDLNDYVMNGPLHLFRTNKFDSDWVKNNDNHMQDFVDAETAKTPVRGEDVPPPNQRREGWQYFDNKAGGIFYWKNGQATVPPKDQLEINSPYVIQGKTMTWNGKRFLPMQ